MQVVHINFYYLFQLHFHEQVCSVYILTSKVPDGRYVLKFHHSESVLSRCCSALPSKYGNITLPQIMPQPFHSIFHSFIHYKPVIFSVLCAEYQKYVKWNFCYARHDGIQEVEVKGQLQTSVYISRRISLCTCRYFSDTNSRQGNSGVEEILFSLTRIEPDSSVVKPVTRPLTHRAIPALQQIKTHLKQP